MIKIKIEIKSRRGESNFMSAIKSIIVGCSDDFESCSDLLDFSLIGKSRIN